LHVATIGEVKLAPGERREVEVKLRREHCDGPAEIHVDGLPAGVSASAATVAERAEVGRVELSADSAALEANGSVRVTARVGATRAETTFRVTVGPPPPVKNSLGMTLVRLRPGKFRMGSPSGEPGRFDDETAHEVTLTRPFYLGAHEVTVGQFRKFVNATDHRTLAERTGKAGGAADPKTGRISQVDGKKINWRNPGWAVTDRQPVTLIGWDDAVAFCRWLSAQEKRTYRLPTEAEWEYACRAGSATAFSGTDDPDRLEGIANLADASLAPELGREASRWNLRDWNDRHPFVAPVGSLRANAWGLYDLHGNVYEWCRDWHGEKSYTGGPRTDPEGPPTGEYRILRGGSWASDPAKCRAAYRHYYAPRGVPTNENGFRVVLEAEQKAP
jgi:formylglycine-generating enzyme required for sulfatase activity